MATNKRIEQLDPKTTLTSNDLIAVGDSEDLVGTKPTLKKVTVETLRNQIGALIPKGTISVNTEFPLIDEVQNNWWYVIDADVTDDAGEEYTNTGDSFIAGQEIYWYDSAWVVVGENRLWVDDGDDLEPIGARGVNIPTGETFKINGTPHTHAHVDTTEKQGGTTSEYYHLTSAQHTGLTGGGSTALHSHAAPNHNDTANKQGGTTSEYYHLTSAQINNLIVLVTVDDIDTPGSVIDSFSDTVAAKGARWDITVENAAGTAVRMFSINAVWDGSTDTINDSGEYGIVSIGDTSDVTFTITIAANVVTLSAVASSDNWKVRAQRYLI